MKTAVADIVSKIQGERRTGLLSFTVHGNSSLFKVFFRDGSIYHLACGPVKGSDCLAQIDDFNFSGHSFISSVKIDANGAGIPPTDEIIAFLHSVGKTTLSCEGQGAPARQGLSPEDSAEMRRRLKVALMKQIGPAGDRIFTRILQGRWDASAPAEKEDLVELIDLLKGEIDDPKDRGDFLHEARTLLSGIERKTL